MAEVTFVLVGHCGPDAYMLKSAVQRAAKSAAIAMVNDQDLLPPLARPGAVWLVNRMLDGDFADESGLDLIRTALGKPQPPAIMLISNFPEAQQEAVAAGARPGFGKTQLYDAATAAKLRDAAGLTSSEGEGT